MFPVCENLLYPLIDTAKVVLLGVFSLHFKVYFKIKVAHIFLKCVRYDFTIRHSHFKFFLKD